MTIHLITPTIPSDYFATMPRLFFKQKNERAPIEQLMKYGPYANSLPIAFLRTETFGAVQSGITNDLQIKRGAQSIKNRITCKDATSYDEIMEVFEDIFEHVKKLELASLHAISKRMEYNTVSNVTGNVVNLFEKKEENNLDIDLDINIDEEIDTEKFEIVMREAEIAFKELTRMGFSAENLENDMYIEAFRIGAGALINIKYQFERFFRELSKLQK